MQHREQDKTLRTEEQQIHQYPEQQNQRRRSTLTFFHKHSVDEKGQHKAIKEMAQWYR